MPSSNPADLDDEGRTIRSRSVPDDDGNVEGQDGGLLGWFAVLSTWVTWFVWGSAVKGLGVLLPTLEEQFSTQAWLIGWIIAIMTGSVGLSGVFASALCARFDTGVVVIVNGVMIGGGFIVASFVTDILQLALLTTFVIGSGLGVANVLTREAVGIRFSENYTTASAIAQSGFLIAMIVFAPLAQLFLDTYGWRGTLLLTGAVSLHLIPCGQLLRAGQPPTSVKYEKLSYDDDTLHQRADDKDESEKRKTRNQGRSMSLKNNTDGCFQFWRSAVQQLDIRLFSSGKFWLLVAIFTGSLLPFDIWYIYFISHAQAKGYNPTDAAMFVTYAGAGSIVFKIAHAPLVDKGYIGLRTMLAVNIFICSLCLRLTPMVDSYWAMAATACAFVSCAAVIVNLFDVLTKVVMGKDRIASAIGWIGVILGVIRIAIGFFPGWIYGETGSYDVAFFILGCMQLGTLVALFCMQYTESQ